MSEETNHITEFAGYAKILIVLLLLTAINIFIANLKPVSWTGGLILLMSTLQAAIALTWFMHLRYDKPFMRGAVIGVFLLYFVVIVITFLDYKFR